VRELRERLGRLSFEQLRDLSDEFEISVPDAKKKRDYIEAVRLYNTELRTIPGRWWNALLYGAEPMETFTIAEESMETPEVDFN